MTAYTATTAKSATLTAATVDVVTLDQAYPRVEIINRDGTADLWVTVDRGQPGSVVTLTPTVAGDGCYYIGPGAARVLADDMPGITATGAATGVSVVRLISTAAIGYTVTGLGS